MYTFYRVTLPPNTPEVNPVVQTLKIPAGTITEIDIEFPAGCQGLANIQLFYETTPLVPYNPLVYLCSDNRTIQTPIEFIADVPPYEITVVGFNLDDSYSHTINIGLTVIETQPESMSSLLLKV
jgi:hypothetical protein